MEVVYANQQFYMNSHRDAEDSPEQSLHLLLVL